MRRLRSVFTASLTIAMLSSCGGGNGGSSSPPPPPPPVLASITITPANGTLELGSNQTFTATGTLTDHSTQDVTQTATWSSSDSTVLLLNNSAGRIGVANTRGPGIATVTAAVGSINGTTQATVVRPTPRFLYAASTGPNGAITAFRVDPTTGSLTLIGTPYSTTNNPVSLAVTRDSKFLYVAESPGYLSGRAIQADGSLLPVPGSPLSLPGSPGGLVAHPTADFLYASTGAGVEFVAYDPTSGVPTSKGSTTVDGSMPGAITPDGLHFYQISYISGWGIAGFSVNSATGALSEIPSGPVYTTVDQCLNPDFGPYMPPREIAVNPAGTFLYVVRAGVTLDCPSLHFDGYSIDPVTGAMTEIPDAPFYAGGNTISVAVDASGRFLFVASGVVLGYSIDPSTGVVTEIDYSKVPTAPTYLVVDPSGLYLYVATASGILGFNIDQTTGALTANPGATAAVNNVQFIAITH